MLSTARVVLVAVVFCLCLQGGAVRSQPVHPVRDVPPAPDPLDPVIARVVNREVMNQEVKRVGDEQKARWAWTSWIFSRWTFYALFALVGGIGIWSRHEKAIRRAQEEEEARKSRPCAWGAPVFDDPASLRKRFDKHLEQDVPLSGDHDKRI